MRTRVFLHRDFICSAKYRFSDWAHDRAIVPRNQTSQLPKINSVVGRFGDTIDLVTPIGVKVSGNVKLAGL